MLKLAYKFQLVPVLIVAGILSSCSQPKPGPDKQFSSQLSGAVVGAGAGAVTGFQVSSATGPGALVGAGFGAVAGGVRGFVQDQTEEQLLKLSAQARAQRIEAQVHEILSEHYKRRLELHPSRDIYPADIFFAGDRSKLRLGADALVREIARLNAKRLPWSRLAVTVYSRGVEGDESFSQHLAESRAKEIVNQLARSGLEARRLEPRGVVVSAPVLLDPDDGPERYNQAVEFIPLDR